MCGRFTLRTPAEQLAERFLFELHEQLAPRFNIAPTQPIAAVRASDAGPREFGWLRWGLIPVWAKDLKSRPQPINARSETVADSNMFRHAFRRRRCAILADGYYEWKGPSGAKQPFHIRMADDRPFAFAGQWERWLGPKHAPLDKPLDSCAIITTSANELTAPIHDRMPVILPADALDLWLDPNFDDPGQLHSLLVPFDSTAMTAMPVTAFVNNVRNEGPQCLAAKST